MSILNNLEPPLEASAEYWLALSLRLAFDLSGIYWEKFLPAINPKTKQEARTAQYSQRKDLLREACEDFGISSYAVMHCYPDNDIKIVLMDKKAYQLVACTVASIGRRYFHHGEYRLEDLSL